MPASGELSKLQALITELGVSLEGLTGERADTLAALRVVFAVNNELGRLARRKGLARGPAWTELQLQVNAVTIELKKGDSAGARAAYARAGALLGRVVAGAR